MRSTSSARRSIAGILSVLLAAGIGGPPVLAADAPPRSPSLILWFHAPEMRTEEARARMAALSRLLPAELSVSWLPVPTQRDGRGETAEPPDPDGRSLERISERLREAARRMERMDTREADLLLKAAERDARSFRPGEALRPYLAEIFLKRGVLLLWDGNRSGAEEMFGRVRVLHPDFAPDPALFSPAFMESWSRAAQRPPAGAEVVVQSIPTGAEIFVDGSKAGATPGRVRVPALGGVAIRLTCPGYVPVELSGHWLPGDSETLDVTLTRDRLSRLEELLAEGEGGKEAGVLLNEMASSAGADRVAVMLLKGNGSAARARVLSLKRGADEPVAAGEFGWSSGDREAGVAAARAASLLRAAGWPAYPKDMRKAASWYHKWWLWALLGAVIAGAAAGAGGGGGSSGGSTGAIGVNF